MIGEIGKFVVQEHVARMPEKLRVAAEGQGAAEKQRAAQEFVSFLLLEVLKAMRATVSQEKFSEADSFPRDIYTSLGDMEIARAMSRRDGMGLVKIVEKALETAGPQGIGRGGNHLPAEGVVSSPFGVRTDPLKGEDLFHRGVDIAAPAGSPVKAVAAGLVVFSGWVEGYGNHITLDHGDGLLTRYAHNQINLVSSGERVAAGQEIALVGSTGRSTAPHLHFEALKERKPIDPLSVFKFQQSVFNLRSTG